MKEGKFSYASRVDATPHKTGIPKEWLNTYTEMIESCINEHPTINQNTISQSEFLDTIRRDYLDGIIHHEDLKHIKYLTDEDIDYITR